MRGGEDQSAQPVHADAGHDIADANRHVVPSSEDECGTDGSDGPFATDIPSSSD